MSVDQGLITAPHFHDLTVLTLGAQLRGGANVRKGAEGIEVVFGVIADIVADAIVQRDDACLRLRNASGRTVLIELAPDPDIVIREEMPSGAYRKIIAIEVKAGADSSNIHNRIGEAEKSHQKARSGGFVECWTVVNVDGIDMNLAHKESPSTNRFYRMSGILKAGSEEYGDFSDRIISLAAIPT